MGIVVTSHGIDLSKKEYVVTIEDDDNVIVDRKNIGCGLTESGEFDEIESIERIKSIVATRRAENSTANVDIDLG
jgi:hypothetical protein